MDMFNVTPYHDLNGPFHLDCEEERGKSKDCNYNK